MKLVNINYKGRIVRGMENFEISRKPPCSAKVTVPKQYTLIVFKSGKCRLMGCKRPLNQSYLTINNATVYIESIQSITVVLDMQRTYILQHVAKKLRVIFEPELFPAARVLEFNPLCVNLFASGKVVITGLKTLNYYKQLEKIVERLNNVC